MIESRLISVLSVFVRNYFYFLRHFLCTVTPLFQEPSPKELADIMEGYGSRKYAEKNDIELSIAGYKSKTLITESVNKHRNINPWWFQNWTQLASFTTFALDLGRFRSLFISPRRYTAKDYKGPLFDTING